MLSIRFGRKDDIPILLSIYDQMGIHDPTYFDQVFERNITVFIAFYNGQPAGFVLLNWDPGYHFFQRFRIPEIQDLNVIPDLRRCGIATALIQQCEEVAKEKGCREIGISVEEEAKRKPAEILYDKLGYFKKNIETQDKAENPHKIREQYKKIGIKELF